MKALLLAAGKATRLGSLSQTTPKCLHNVGDEILLDRIIRQLYEAGVQKFLINTHHLAPLIEDHILARPDKGKFTIVHEVELLGTLGTLRANVDFFDNEPYWVLHADNFIAGSLRGLRDSFNSRPPQVTAAMLTFVTDQPDACGVVLTDSNGVVTDFFEKVIEPPSRQASAATFLFDYRVMSQISALPPSATDISRHLLPHLTHQVLAVPHDDVVIDIGTRDGLTQARKLARSKSL